MYTSTVEDLQDLKGCRINGQLVTSVDISLTTMEYVNALVEIFFSLKGENEFMKESFFYFTKVKIMFRNIFFENNEISCTIF